MGANGWRMFQNESGVSRNGSFPASLMWFARVNLELRILICNARALGRCLTKFLDNEGGLIYAEACFQLTNRRLGGMKSSNWKCFAVVVLGLLGAGQAAWSASNSPESLDEARLDAVALIGTGQRLEDTGWAQTARDRIVKEFPDTELALEAQRLTQRMRVKGCPSTNNQGPWFATHSIHFKVIYNTQLAKREAFVKKSGVQGTGDPSF